MTETTPKLDYVALLSVAYGAAVTPERATGCGRVYVSLPKEHSRGLAAACKKLGKVYLTKAYGAGSRCIYVGYDNADGIALARGTAIVATLKGAGIEAYRDEVAD